VIASSAHQRRVQQALETVAAAGADDGAVALLRQLVASLPTIRAILPSEQQAALDELDQNEQALTSAIAGLNELITTALSLAGDDAYLTDADRLGRLTGALNQLAQLAGEGTLRAKERAALLKRLS
jgi:hypothetical protein